MITSTIPGEPCEWCGAPTTYRTIQAADTTQTPAPVKGWATLAGPGLRATFRVFSCSKQHADQAGAAKLGDRDAAAKRAAETMRLGALGEVTPVTWRKMRREQIDWETRDMRAHRELLCWYLDTLPERLAAGEGLHLWGKSGNGKSLLAAICANEAAAAGASVRFESASHLIEQWLNAPDRIAYRLQLARVGLLVIDELGTETPSSVAQEALFRVFDERYNAGRPTITTTNLSSRQISDRYAGIDRNAMIRLLDRHYERSAVIEFTGEGYRGRRRPNFYALARQHAAQIAAAGRDDDDIPEF